MASLAGLLKQRGFKVTGSDAAAYPPMSDFLASIAIPILQPYSESNLKPWNNSTYISLEFAGRPWRRSRGY